MSDEAPVISVRGLRVATDAGSPIVEDVSLEARAGDVLALVGESGCGKTTTALALLGHARAGLRIVGGSVTLDGADLLALDPGKLDRLRGQAISYVPQDPTSALNPRHRVGSQLREALLVHERGRAEADSVVHELVDHVGLPGDKGFLRRYPFELSGGQQQRIAIAMALACRPRVVVLDEPTTGLDVTTQARVLSLVRDLAAERSAAFIYVTHDLAVVDTLATRVVVLYAGRVVESGSCDDVMLTPAHPYSALLLRAVPRMRSRELAAGIPGTAPSAAARSNGCAFTPRCPIAVADCDHDVPPMVKVGSDHHAACLRPSSVSAAGRLRTDGPALAQNAPEALLDVRALSASYGPAPVLHDVTFSLGRGGCMALVGESGSGKTTLGRCVVGLHKPRWGSIALHGEPLAPAAADRTPEQRQAIQIVFQNPDRSLNPSQTVREQIARPLQLFRLASKSEIGVQVSELLARVRLPSDRLDRYPRELSGGEKQRVAIARALAPSPQLLVCDEVTSALDVSIQAAVVELLAELRADGVALLFITHNLALVSSFAEDVLVLQRGVVTESGTAKAVLDAPHHEYTRALIAAVPERRPVRT